VADYEGIIKVPNLVVVTEVEFNADGEAIPFRRLAGTGLFGDPNDLSLMIVGCVIYTAYLLCDRSVSLPLRALWLIPLPLLFETLILTYSRGGAMSLMIGLWVYVLVRFGWRRAFLLSLLALPVLLRAGGRQMDFDVSGGTGQGRIVLWDAYMQMFMQSPLFGVGYGQPLRNGYQVAHNSYIHVFTERGFFGGMSFLSAVLLSVWALVRSRPSRGRPLGVELERQGMYLLASVCSYAVGIMTLSRSDVIPTYTVLGLAVAYERMASAASGRETMRLTPKMIGLLAAASVVYLIVMFFFIRRSANYY
jgi:hypothetical protein